MTPKGRLTEESIENQIASLEQKIQTAISNSFGELVLYRSPKEMKESDNLVRFLIESCRSAMRRLQKESEEYKKEVVTTYCFTFRICLRKGTWEDRIEHISITREQMEEGVVSNTSGSKVGTITTFGNEFALRSWAEKRAQDRVKALYPEETVDSVHTKESARINSPSLSEEEESRTWGLV